MSNLELIGNKVILTEIVPEYFSDVVRWRNNKELNKYLNQPKELTVESEENWYRQKYLQDDKQGFMIFLDKEKSIPFATIGWTDMDKDNRCCILGRLILGNQEYRNHPGFLEGFFLLADYLYQFVDVMYIHLAGENRKAHRLNKMLGFVPNQGEMKYPQEAVVNNINQKEFLRTKDMYRTVRKKLYEDLKDSLFKG